MGLHLWIPNDTRRVIDRCRVPTPEGPCGHEFYEGEEAQIAHHVNACCRRNLETIREERERQHPEIMKPWDPEFASWVKANGRAIMEGRKRVGGGVR